MPTTVTKTLKSTGGDYVSFAAWQAALAGDITATTGSDEVHVLECYEGTTTTGGWQADGSLAEAVDISGWTTDATHTVTIKSAAGEGHGGVIGTGFRLSISTANHTLTNSSNYTIFQDFEARHTGDEFRNALYTGAGSNCTFERCIFVSSDSNKDSPIEISINANNYIFRNILALALTSYDVLRIDSRRDQLTFQNCTFIQKDGTSDALEYFITTNTTPVHNFQNCVFYGNLNLSTVNPATDGTCEYNAFTDSTDAFGTNQVTTLDSTDFNDFTNNDYSPSSGGDLIDAGTDLSGTFTDDIAGNTRG